MNQLKKTVYSHNRLLFPETSLSWEQWLFPLSGDYVLEEQSNLVWNWLDYGAYKAQVIEAGSAKIAPKTQALHL